MERTCAFHIKRTMIPVPHAPPIFCIKIYIGTEKHEIHHMNPQILDNLAIHYLQKKLITTEPKFDLHDRI